MTTRKATHAYMIQKTKAVWLQEGDENTSFFHNVLKKRQYQSRVISISQNGILITEKKEVLQHFIQYYARLLGTPAPTTSRVRTEVLDADPRLNLQQQVALIKPFSMADVKAAVFSIHDAKSPGHDGYSSGFFKTN